MATLATTHGNPSHYLNAIKSTTSLQLMSLRISELTLRSLPYRKTENLILNHMSNIALRTGQLPEKMTSLVTGNPPLWITRDRGGIYVNQAKVLAENIEGRSERGDEQVIRSRCILSHVLLQHLTQTRQMQYSSPSLLERRLIGNRVQHW